MNRFRLGFLLPLSLLVPACGGGSDVPPPSPAMLHIRCDGATAGGSAVTGSAFGGAGTIFQFSGGGSVTSGLVSPIALPPSPVPPTSGTELLSLAADYTQASGNILVSGTLTATGAATRTITASHGDLVVSGTLLSGQNTGAQINLALSAPHGTIFVSGAIRTGSADGVLNGTSSGTLSLSAARVVMTGILDTTGEANTAGIGASGGNVTILTNAGGSDIVLGGSIVLDGGNGSGGKGGFGGGLTVTAGTELYVVGSLRGDGGSTTVTTDAPTGAGGSFLNLQGPAGVYINATLELLGGDLVTTGQGASSGNPGGFNAQATTGRVEVFGTITIRGGAATAAGASAGTPIMAGPGTLTCSVNGAGGVDLGLLDASAIGGFSSDSGGQGGRFGFASTAGDVRISGTITATGGTGAIGGPGGSVIATAQTGDVDCDATLILTGGSAAVTPSRGGGIILYSGAAGTGNGSVWARGLIDLSGGSSTSASSAPGGDGGVADIEAQGPGGRVTLDTGLTFRADGGAATGAGTGGAGGILSVTTLNELIQLGAQIHATGGSGTLSSGTGGQGGRVAILSDGFADGVGGDITLYAGSVITVSGGPGQVGGSARRGPVGSKAVEFDADGNNSNAGTNGFVSNFGLIVADGGGPGGTGGDVLFDGLNNGLTPGPVEGLQSRAGKGGALDGLFTSQ